MHETNPSLRDDLRKEIVIRIKSRDQATLLTLARLFVSEILQDIITGQTEKDDEFVLAILEKLDRIENPYERMQLGLTLFGTLYEDVNQGLE